MNRDRWTKARELFDRARAMSADSRAVFLLNACDGDADLQREVESLLLHHDLALAEFMRVSWPGRVEPNHENAEAPLIDQAQNAPVPSLSMSKLKGYKILREIGKGGMGQVWQARDTKLDRIVAIKAIVTTDQTDIHYDLFNREAQLTARLRHPNIVTIYSYEPNQAAPYFVMEWVDGEPLSEYCRRRHLSARDAAALLERIARAVAYAHAHNVVHRDLKPQNILVDSLGEPRILDFGLARIAARVADDSSIGGVIKGTPAYMAPEQIVSPNDVGRESDVYALGLILYELITGSAPPKPPPLSNLEDWARRDMPLPREMNPDVPEALQRICLKATESDIRKRYRTADHLADDLNRFLRGKPVTTKPSRYARLLECRVREHIDVLTNWEQEHLITHRELDALHDRYLRLLRADSYWVPGARRLRIGPVLTQLGGWLLVISAILWPWFYWEQDFTLRSGGHWISLSDFGKVFFEAVPTFLVNIGAIRLWKRGQKLNALIFTVTGVLLLPLCTVVIFGVSNVFEYRLAFPKPASTGSGFEGEALIYELFSTEYFSNMQVFLAAIVGLVYGIWWLTKRRYALLSATVVILSVMFWVSLLLVSGGLAWMSKEWFALTALLWLPFVAIMGETGARLDRPGFEHLATPFYAITVVGFLSILAVICIDAPKSFLDLKSGHRALEGGGYAPDVLRCARAIAGFLAGILVLLIALRLDRAATRLRRLWGAILFRLVPPICLMCLDVLGDEPIWTLLKQKGHLLTPIELTVPLFCFVLAGFAMRFQLRWFLYYSLIHLAWFIFRTTDRFLDKEVAWPFTLVGIGMLALVLGLWTERLFSRRSPDASPAPG